MQCAPTIIQPVGAHCMRPFPQNIISMIKFSVEILFHFQCGICEKWWTVGDWIKSNYLNCPHCGTCQEVIADESDL
jgi:hypothetical protein